MASGTNPLLLKSINRVMSSPEPTQVTISLKIVSPSNPEFLWKADFVESFVVLQDFLGNYGDDITTEITIAPRDYLRLHENMKDLVADVTLTYLGNNTAQKTFNKDPDVRQYRVMLIDPQDLRRQIQGAKQRVEATMKTTLRLIDPLLYDVRQRQFHGTFNETTMEGVIRYIANAFGIERVSLTTPDNVHVYDHIIIPPSKGFEEIFAYLQDRYGVYLKGICSYITNRTLYIYPPFENRPKSPRVAHFYLGDQGEYAGAHTYHRVDGNVIEIVLDGNPDIADLAQMGGENEGTGYILSRSNQIMDGYIETTDTGSKFTHSSSMSVSLQGVGTLTPNRHNLKQAPMATDNIFILTSQLVKFQASVVHADWPKAVPHLLHPGHRCKYVYDDEGNLATTEGILEGAGYEYIRMGPIGDGNYNYNSNGRVRFRVDPDHIS